MQAIIGLLCAAVATADQSHHQSFKQVPALIVYDDGTVSATKVITLGGCQAG